MRSPTSPRRLGAGRRLLWRSLLGGALVAGAVALFTGCRENRDVGTANVGLADLRAMVLPREQLGLLGIGLKLSGSSGSIRNRTAARDSIDPDDTARTLTKSGRLGGYSLVYRQPHVLASPADERPLIVSTEVELFRDDAAASSYLRGQVATAMRLRGKNLPVGRIAAVERFGGGDVGDEAEGLRSTVVLDNDRVAYGTAVGFRRGRLVASVTVVQQVETGGPRDVMQIAGTLDDRIERVAAGEIPKPLVKLPREAWWEAVPDPRPLTLEGAEVATRAALTHRRYMRTPRSLVYWREFELRRGRLGGSRISWLRTMSESFKSARLARRDQAYLGSARRRGAAVERLVRGLLRRGDVRATNLKVRALPGAGGDSAGLQGSFDLPGGRFELVLLSVRRGRLRGSVTALGRAGELRPEDVLALRGKLRARLASV